MPTLFRAVGPGFPSPLLLALVLAAAPAGASDRLVLRGHAQPPTALAWSPDGRVLATGGGDGTVLVWDTATGQRLAALEGLQAPVADLAVSGNLRAVAAAARDGQVILWSTRTAKVVWRYRPAGPLPAGGESPRVAFCPATRRLAAGFRGGALVVYDLKSGALVPAEGEPGPVTDIAWSPGGAEVAVARETAQGRGVIVFRSADDLQKTTGRVELRAPVAALAYAGNLSAFGAALADGGLRVWSVPVVPEAAEHREHGGTATAFRLCGDGGRYISAGPRSVRLWDRQDGSVRTVSAPEGSPYVAVEPAADGELIASTTGGGPEVRVWRLQDAEPVVEQAADPDAPEAGEAALDARISLLGAQVENIERQLELYLQKAKAEAKQGGDDTMPAYTIPLSVVVAINRLTQEKARLIREVERLKEQKAHQAAAGDPPGEEPPDDPGGPDP